MTGSMRPSAPRAQTYSTMRPASQVPRMMSAQRVGQCSQRSQQVHFCRAACFLLLNVLLLLQPLSLWLPDQQRALRCVEYRSTSTQQESATPSSTSALSHKSPCSRYESLCVNHWFPLWRFQLVIPCAPPPPACSPCSGAGASDGLHAGCCSTAGTEADAG